MSAAEPPSPEVSPGAYQPGLDGLRAIAVVAVLLFHGGMNWLPGGFLGVDVFFVLSGYLITGILVRNPGGSFRAFYLRRIRRLYPALFTMLFVTVTCAAILMPDAAATAVRDLPWALTFLSNWWFVFHHVPYFEAMGRPPLFRHTWSLAVEFQFYLIWPVAVHFTFRKFGKIGVRYLALACAAASVVLLGFLSLKVDATADSSRAYFGTDSHSMGIFLGATLATSRGLFAGITSRSRILIDTLGVVTLVILGTLFHSVDESISSYRYGLPLASLCSMVLIAIAILPGSAVARWLATAPLRWIGTRSYSIYVWHWPVFQATRPGIDATPNPGLNLLLRLALTSAIAELSYRFIEMPMRLGVLSHFKGIGTRWSTGWNPKFYRLTAAGLVATALAAGVGEIRLIRQALEADNAPSAVIPLPPPAVAPAATIPTNVPAAGKDAVLPEVERPAILNEPTMLLGDSVLLGVSQWLSQQVNVVKVDATVGRQAKQLRERAEVLAAEPLPPVVIVNLGNNGTVEEATFRAIMDSLKPCKRVVVVNTRVPRKWRDADNEVIDKVVPDYPNAILADWRAAAEGHPEYFGSDGLHANVAGAKAFTRLIVSTLTKPPVPASSLVP